MNYVEYVVEQLVAVFPDADVRPGSALRDLLINPLSSILQPFADEQADLLTAFSMLDPTAISDDDMDAIASNFLITRSGGAKATGNVRFYFSQPINITVPRNTRVSTEGGLNFYVLQDHTTTQTEMFLNNSEFPLYSTNEILVEAELTGSAYSVGPNTITVTDFTTSNPVRVRNPVAFATVADTENNAALKTRTINSFHNNSIASQTGILNTLQATYSSLLDVVVVGAGHADMNRDVIYSGIDKTDLLVTDFYGKVSGFNDYPYNQSIGYVGDFTDQDPTAGVSLPAITGFTQEWSTAMYSNIYLDDDLYTENTSLIILNETFRTEIVDEEWIQSEVNAGQGEAPLHLIEIDTSMNALKMGGMIDSDNKLDTVIAEAISALRKTKPEL
tara:strand:- start:591 stop:1754 length:1164 start_codon:yes stop_codon:yes gene_type:complete